VNMNSAYSPRGAGSAHLHRAAIALVVLAASASAQVSSDEALTGKYFFRQVALLTAATTAAGTAASISQTESASGTLSFDGFGSFTVLGVQLTGISPSTTLSGTGTYTVSPGGFVTMTNPLLPGVTVNARVGQDGVLVGSSTEAGPNTFDLLIAIQGAANPMSDRALTGPYWVSSLEFPNGGVADVRDTNFELTFNGQGGIADGTVTGQANNLGNTLLTQSVTSMSYALQIDGSGTMTFPAAAGLTSTTQLIEGVETIYATEDGSYFIGGSTAPGGHGLMVGVRAWAGGSTNSASNASWTGFYFGAGMRYDTSTATLSAVTASVNPTSQGAVWERRTRESGNGVFDTTPLLTYSLNPDGSGTYTSTQGHVDLASTALVFSSSGVDVASSTAYELYFGASVIAQSGPGPFLQPLGVFNAASYAPPGFPVSPGGFVALFGNGLAPATAEAGIPFPTILENVQVTVNGIPAPLYLVSPTQIDAVVPYGVTGSTATFVVIDNAAPPAGEIQSNPVTVPLAATAPGVFSLTANGLGSGAILHGNYSVVTQASPAVPLEIVQVYLTGLGAVNPAVPNGTAAPSGALVTAPVSVFVGGIQVPSIRFQGLSPGSASLYQLNIQIPSNVGPGPQPLEVQTAAGSTSLVDIWVGP